MTLQLSLRVVARPGYNVFIIAQQAPGYTTDYRDGPEVKP
jgi:hypothetical protein